MQVPLTFRGVFLAVVGAALAGMVLGALFGLGAGALAPSLFEQYLPWIENEPVGTATVLGATGGVFLGGALGVFALLMQVVGELLASRSRKPDAGGPGG